MCEFTSSKFVKANGFSHTTVVMVLLCFLTIRTFNNPAVNGLDAFYDGLVQRDETRSIAGNYEGSALSFKSKGAIIFGLVHSFGDFALVIMDTSFWQKGKSNLSFCHLPRVVRCIKANNNSRVRCRCICCNGTFYQYLGEGVLD